MKMRHLSSLFFSAVVLVPAAFAQVEHLNSGKVVKGSLPFSEVVKANNLVYLSGQVGLDPATQKLVPGGVQGESRQTMENIKTVLEAHGYSMKDVIKCTAFLVDMKDFASFNDAYKAYFQDGKYPARSTVAVTGLALNARVEVECIAVSRSSQN